MTISVTEVGEWESYVPSPLPAGAPSNAMFCRRKSDGMDWYTLAHAKNQDGTYANFGADTVKMTLLNTSRGWLVQAVNKEHERLFPQNSLLLEVTGITDADPQAAYGQKIYDRTAKTFTTYVKPPLPLPDYAANVRYQKEIGGITVSGAPIATDRTSQAMISGAYNYVTQNPSATIKWKTDSGVFVTLDASAITGIALAVGAHVQACFAKEADVQAQISAGTITTAAQIDAAFASF